jgi:hypothetical protein
MEGFVSKAISLVLIVLMLIIAPLIHTYGVHDAEARMELLSDVTEFLDKVTDKHSITQDDLDSFILKVESHGLVLSVSVDRKVKTATLMPTGEVSTTYIVADDMSVINPRDIVCVHIEETSTTPFKRFCRTILKIDEGDYVLDMAKMAK